MQIELSATGREQLAQSQQHKRGVRNWKRYQAIRLLDQGHTPLEVAVALGCRKSSVYDWVGVWEQVGSPGLHEDHHLGGRGRQFSGTGWRSSSGCWPPIRSNRGEKPPPGQCPCC